MAYAKMIAGEISRRFAIIRACSKVGLAFPLMIALSLGAVIPRIVAISFCVIFISESRYEIVCGKVGVSIGKCSFSYSSTREDNISNSIRRGSSADVDSSVEKNSSSIRVIIALYCCSVLICAINYIVETSILLYSSCVPTKRIYTNSGVNLTATTSL